MATKSTNKVQAPTTNRVIGDAVRIFMLPDGQAPVRRDGKPGKSAALLLKAPTAQALEALAAQVQSMGTLDQVLRRAARDGEPAIYEDNVQVSDRRYVYSSGRTVSFDPETGEARGALFLVPRDNATNQATTTTQATTQAPSGRPVTSSTLSPEALALANAMGLDAKQAQAMEAFLKAQKG